MEFSDGMKFDLQAEAHLERRSDGWYVVGGRMLIPVASQAEGKQTLASMKAQKAAK